MRRPTSRPQPRPRPNCSVVGRAPRKHTTKRRRFRWVAAPLKRAGRAGVEPVRDPLRGKEIAILDGAGAKVRGALTGPKKQILGALRVPGHGLLVWSADRTTRLYPVGA